MARGAVLCVSHGGGPLPVLGDPGHADIIDSLKNRASNILRLGTPEAPRAIVVVTAHWSESQPGISSAAHHTLYYDYGGFPSEAYRLKYDAPGSPEVAVEVRGALEQEGFRPVLNSTRGWDHGVFIPMLLINPVADVPIIQLSTLSSEDPAAHIRMGKALAKLRDSNIAILGSGFASIHNMQALFGLMSGGAAKRDILNKVNQWNEALTNALSETRLEREKKLVQWRQFPHSFEIHPRHGAEHFMPLLVCAGASGDDKLKSYQDRFHGAGILSFYWE